MNNINNENNMSRRDFISITGKSIVGMAALASVGWATNNKEVDTSKITYNENQCDVLVIGSGMAGLFAAVKAHDAGAKVIIVSKGRLGASGQTPFAKGIFAYNPATEEMSIDKFVEQISLSAINTNNKTFTRQLAEHSFDRINELKEWGFFESKLYNKSFSNPIKERKIKLDERIVITHLIKENGKIAGAAGFSLDEEKVLFYNAKSVILCTGAGGFKPNGFPICDLTHDGTVMAYDIGAKVTGKEWNDGHVGRATNAAACYDGWGDMFEKKPGITGIGIRHDLGVDLNYQVYMNGNPVKMGSPGKGISTTTKGGPKKPTGLISQRERTQGDGRPPKPKDGKSPEGGGPPGMGGTSVGGASAGMAIHKAEGLTPINEKCESTIPGLYAAGDALGSHMSGGIYTQIGSSLAGSAVQGAIAGEAATEYCNKVKLTDISKSQRSKIKSEILAPLNREAGYSPAWVTQTLQGIMIPNFVLYIKKESMMNAALAYIEELRDHHLPLMKAAGMHELRLYFETKNMIANAEMKLRASLMRKESRCSHYRLDYPEIDKKNWNAWINIYKGKDGEMKLEKQPFDTWPT